jgi:hypothetical protein
MGMAMVSVATTGFLKEGWSDSLSSLRGLRLPPGDDAPAQSAGGWVSLPRLVYQIGTCCSIRGGGRGSNDAQLCFSSSASTEDAGFFFLTLRQ